MILRSSKAVALILIGSMSVLWGFKSCVDRGYYTRTAGATTRPSSGSSHYFWGSGRSRGSSSSVTHSGTSRGGFGSSGHHAGS